MNREQLLERLEQLGEGSYYDVEDELTTVWRRMHQLVKDMARPTTSMRAARTQLINITDYVGIMLRNIS